MWYDIIRNAKDCEKNPYRVIEVSYNMIYDFKQYTMENQWMNDAEAKKIPWSKIKQVQTSVENRGILNYKLKLDDKNFHAYQVARHPNNFVVDDDPLALTQKAYDDKIPISSLKYKDLNCLVEHLDIPIQHHKYYQNLKVAQVSVEQEPVREEEHAEIENELEIALAKQGPKLKKNAVKQRNGVKNDLGAGEKENIVSKKCNKKKLKNKKDSDVSKKSSKIIETKKSKKTETKKVKLVAKTRKTKKS